MTDKEITILRKSGKLDEALAAAEENYELISDKYNASALFWCLNDLAKRSDSNVQDIFERMKNLYDTHCSGDRFMQPVLASMEKKMLPHAHELRKALDSAKAGNGAIKNCRIFVKHFNEDELDNRLYNDFGWLIYYALKETPVNEALNRKQLLNKYLMLKLEAPSLLHSLITREAVVVEKNTPLEFLFSAFVELWDLDNLRDEDWEQYKTDGGMTLPSLVEKIIGVYVKEMKTNKSLASEKFCIMFDKALARYSNNQNMPYFKAQILISQGNRDEAMSYYRDMIIRSPMKAYLWNQLAELVEDRNTKIGLLCRALNTGDKDEFLGKIRLRLATLLIMEGKLENARFEIENYYRTYSNNKWPLKDDYQKLESQLQNIKSSLDNKSLYSDYFLYADDFIYHDLQSVYAVKVSDKMEEDPKKHGNRIMKWVLESESKTFRLSKPRKFGLDNRISNGTIFEIKEQAGKIVWIKGIVEPPTLKWLKTSQGQLSIKQDKNGKKYAIIERCYISEKLLQGFHDNQNVCITAVKQNDGRWKAVSVIGIQ